MSTQFARKQHSRKPSNEGLQFANNSMLSLVNEFVHAVGAMEETVLVPSRLMDVGVASPVGDAAVLSPSAALLHRAVPKWASKSPSDLFSFFNAVKRVHNTLLWGGKEKPEGEPQPMRAVYTPAALPSLAVTTYPMGSSSSSTSGCVTPISPPSPTSAEDPATTMLSSHHHHHHNQNHRNSGGSGDTLRQASSSASLASGFEDGDDAEVSSTDDSSDSGLDQEQGSREDPLKAMADKFSAHLAGMLDCLDEFTRVAHVVSQRYHEEVVGAPV
ncbi:unnamed protein product [Notodromas monacha]|uniref:Mid1-interacting protein n=1 Tax=Notodromas monacha TaxID=399045 RepID=A0A7R9BRM3_9CRUS|nr:unnamed protein product [Notodromas monacha]CAG0919532.1 unnamed protein product [Notodromas monacha]